MKSLVLFIAMVLSMKSFSLPSGVKSDSTHKIVKNEKMENSKINIKVNSKVFTATLYDNKTAKAFKALLPLTIKMDELNGNEKKYDFSKDLPTENYNPKQINSGDLMLWSGNTLVLFYKSFSTPYSYTKLGKIDDATGLVSALGSGDVTVSFEMK